MPKEIRNGILAFIGCVLLVFICYEWIDKPVFYWVYSHHLNQIALLKWFTHIPEAFIASLGIIYPLLVIRFCYGKWTTKDKIILATSNSLAIAYFLRGPLKFVFGRYWPISWIDNNPSLLGNNAYGFKWFHNSTAYQAFPSGHETATVAVMALIWIVYPKLRWVSVMVSLIVAIGLIGMCYHFVGDVIAGGFLGALTAYYTAKISRINSK